ncbi:hypothetical protein J4440_06250 [Candidatus Woesearchaeota archaeon]|nr:hypothetical protein [Candidatus Woesearchaeota archaeon]
MSIQDDLKSKKPVFGYDVAVKKIKTSGISIVYVASNFIHKDKLRLLAKTNKFDLIELEQTNKQIGTLCKKPFNISVVSFN